MSLARKLEPALDFDTFVEMIRARPDDERWELIGGRAYLMAPPLERHQTLVGNLFSALRPMAREKGCSVYPGLGIASHHASKFATIPDVVVRCGAADSTAYFNDPVIVAEVLSPSTMAFDRGPKLEFYQGIESLLSILLVYADEARIEHWRREGPEWLYDVASGVDARVILPPLDNALSLADVYEGVAFKAPRSSRG